MVPKSIPIKNPLIFYLKIFKYFFLLRNAHKMRVIYKIK